MRWVFGVAVAAVQVPFDSSEASSTLSAEFQASNALTPSLDYWCSEGNLLEDEVTWKGHFNVPTEVRAVEITWALAPSQVKLLGNSDQLTDHVLLDWRGATSQDPSFTEVLEFSRGAESLMEIKVVMKGVLHDYIGIQQVRPIGSDEQIFMLLSGVEAPALEQCVHGVAEFTRARLDDCEYGLASGDGRDVWMITPTGQIMATQASPPACLAFDLSDKDHPLIMLRKCADTDSKFDYMGNAQLQAIVGRNERQCLVAQGSAGFRNVLADKTQGSESSSVMDVDHDADNALTASSTNYWASKAFEDAYEHNVFWQYDFGEPTAVDKIKIDWEYPPLAYSLMQSGDGIKYSRLLYNPVNTNNVTLDEANSSTLRFLRISMHKPHPVHGKVAAGKYAYGIRSVQVLQSKLALTLMPCEKAAMLPTGGDRWFMVPVRTFRADDALQKRSSNTDYMKILETVQNAAADLIEASSDMQKCKGAVTELNEKYRSRIAEVEPDIVQRLAALMDERGLIADSASGMSESNPLVHGCPTTAIGFYHVSVPCAPSRSMRVFCAEGDGYHLYDGARVTSRKSTLDIERACASEGLGPLSLKTGSQFEALVSYIRSVFNVVPGQTPPDVNIPLAFDVGCATSVCSDMFFELAHLTDVTGILMRYADPLIAKPAKATALALTSLASPSTSVTYSDWLLDRQTHFLCSLGDASAVSQFVFVAALDCQTTGTSPVFQGGPNTYFRVGCPSNCHLIEDHHIYGGVGNVYADQSHVCKAAVHAGVGLDRLQSFVLITESANANYPALTRYGVSSYALGGTASSSFRILAAGADACPIDRLLMSDGKDRNKLSQKPSSIVLPKTIDWAEGERKGKQKALQANLNSRDASYMNLAANEATHRSWNATSDLIDSILKVDGMSITFARQLNIQAIVDGRALVKPIETTVRRLSSRSEESFVTGNRALKKVTGVVSELYARLQSTQQRMLLLRQMLNRKIAPFRLDESTAIEKDFVIWDNGTPGANAAFTTVKLNANTTALRMTGDVSYSNFGSAGDTAADFLEGQPLLFPSRSFLATRDNYAYDAEVEVAVQLGEGHPVATVGWHVRPARGGDGYWMVLKRAAGDSGRVVFKIIRRSQGRVSVISKWASFQVYTPGTAHIRVVIRRGRHSVQIDDYRVLDFIDETIATGAVGVGALALAGSESLSFAIHVKPLCCLKAPVRRAPKPPACAQYHDRHLVAPSKLFESTSLAFLAVDDKYGKPRAYEARAPLVRVPTGAARPGKATQWLEFLDAQSIFTAPERLPRYDEEHGMLLEPETLLQSAVPPQQPFVALLSLPHRDTHCALGQFRVDMMLLGQCPDMEAGIVLANDANEYEWISVDTRGLARTYMSTGTDSVPTLLQETYIGNVKPVRWYRFSTYITADTLNLLLENPNGPTELATVTHPHKIPNPHRVGIAFRNCDVLPFNDLHLKP